MMLSRPQRSELPPWLLPVLDRLLALCDEERLHHALLLTGATGVGKRLLASALVRGLLCRADPGERPCGHCRDCRLSVAGSHPDIRELTPNPLGLTASGASESSKTRSKKKQTGEQRRGESSETHAQGAKGLSGGSTAGANEHGEIVIDGVRELVDFLHLSAQRGGHRAALIVPCDRLNRAAANGLLKVLEEPPGGTFLVLATDRPARLPATIRSRCASYTVPRPEAAAAQEWLAARYPKTSRERLQRALILAAGTPLRAEAVIEQRQLERFEELLRQLERLSAGGDPVKEAEAWQEEPRLLVDLLLQVIVEVLRYRQTGQGSDGDLDLLPASLVTRLAQQITPERGHQLSERLLLHRRHLEQPLQGRLSAEAIWLDWLSAVKKETPCRSH
ncbi:hypothetical protein CKO15_04910 [Halorhodospira abdelmalekii]|uniref:hypothetical protein n=1 Tax=Halorhodospira abdelmalekii TaxID=421629 RepID=UPI001907B6DA|nr:hypothetical protein [Halorhodospira abdelmalekii]MBK1734636.1 hypothetical protein [Halorhodospira abdelmalekii]